MIRRMSSAISGEEHQKADGDVRMLKRLDWMVWENERKKYGYILRNGADYILIKGTEIFVNEPRNRRPPRPVSVVLV